MTGAMKGAVLSLWIATIVVAFAAGRMTAPDDSAPTPDDLGAAVRAAHGEIDGLDRAEHTARVLQHLDAENVAEVATVYDQMLNILGETDIRPFVIAWSRFDPGAALDHTLAWPLREKQKLGAGAAIETWAMSDPAGAMQAYERTSARHPSLEFDLFLDLLTGWVYSGQPGLDEYLASLPKTKLDSGVSRVVGKLMRQGGVDTTVAWVDSILRNDAFENKVKKKVFRRGVRMVGRANPERAAAWALEYGDEPYGGDGLRIVAEQWGVRDGLAAMQWVRELPDDENRVGAARAAFRTWLMNDRKNAKSWLEAETLTPFHDPVVVFYAKDLSDRSPGEAIAWCERVSDTALQLDCLQIVAGKWYQRDPLSAEAWLQQSPLDEQARTIARRPPKTKPQRGKLPANHAQDGPG